jgi:prophage antirepressor-like protein
MNTKTKPGVGSDPFHGQTAPAPSIFSFRETFGIRIVTDPQGHPWFVLADVCKAIDYIDPSQAQKLIDLEDLRKLEVADAMGRVHPAWCCTEPGLYQFLCSSQVEKAKPFRRWVFAEVLPAIRRQGCYGEPLDLAEQLRLQTALFKFLGDLQGCTCAFSRKLMVDMIRVLCRQLGQPLPDLSLIGKDPWRTNPEGC